MATVTVDLPAHNVASTKTTVPDPECLADPTATTGITITRPGDEIYVGSTGGLSGGEALGFGLFELPANAHLVDIRCVAHAQRLGASFDVPPGSWDASVVAPVPTVGPSLAVDYDDRRGFETGHDLGYTLTPTDVLTEIVGDPIAHSFTFSDPITEPPYDVVIAGVGSPPHGTFGLGPRVVIADSNWWEFPAFDSPILLTYLALRITYITGGSNPRRRYPPINNGGSGPTRHLPNAGNRRAGHTY